MSCIGKRRRQTARAPRIPSQRLPAREILVSCQPGKRTARSMVGVRIENSLFTVLARPSVAETGLMSIERISTRQTLRSRAVEPRAAAPMARRRADQDRGFDIPSLQNKTPQRAGFCFGGERGIRTLDTVSRIHAFQACAFSHSATSPSQRTPAIAGRRRRLPNGVVPNLQNASGVFERSGSCSRGKNASKQKSWSPA